MRPLIHSTKHYVQMSRSTVLTVAANNEDLAHSVTVPNKDAVDEVEEGASVKAVYIELWLLDSSNDGSNIVVLSKEPTDGAGPAFGNMNALGTYPNKKNILFTHQGLTPNDGVVGPVRIMANWYPIPKSKQRFGLGDKLVLTIANNGANNLFYCGFATYKEYT